MTNAAIVCRNGEESGIGIGSGSSFSRGADAESMKLEAMKRNGATTGFGDRKVSPQQVPKLSKASSRKGGSLLCACWRDEQGSSGRVEVVKLEQKLWLVECKGLGGGVGRPLMGRGGW